MIVPPWVAPVAAAVAIVGAFGAGWQVRSWKADADALVAAKALEAANDRARAAVEKPAIAYEDTRAKLDAQRPVTQTTIREIYRDRPAPPVDCAAPDAARRLLVTLGATGDAAATGEPRGPVRPAPVSP